MASNPQASVQRSWEEMTTHLLHPLTPTEEKVALIPAVGKRENVPLDKLATLLIKLASSDDSTSLVKEVARDVLAMRVTAKINGGLTSEAGRYEQSAHKDFSPDGKITKVLLDFYAGNPTNARTSNEKQLATVRKFASALLELEISGILEIEYTGNAIVRAASFTFCHEALRKNTVITAIPFLCQQFTAFGEYELIKLMANWQLMPMPRLDPDKVAQAQIKETRLVFEADIAEIRERLSYFSVDTRADHLVMTILHLLWQAEKYMAFI